MVDPAGESEDVLPLVRGPARGDQGTGGLRRLDHEHGVGEGRDEPVPEREVVPARAGPRRELREEQTLDAHAGGERTLGPGAVDAGAEDRDGRPSRGERALVGGRVHAPRETADDGDAARAASSYPKRRAWVSP